MALVKRVRQGDGAALRHLLRRVQPGSFTELQEIIYPDGGMSQIMFNFLCDEYDEWRGLSLSAAC